MVVHATPGRRTIVEPRSSPPRDRGAREDRNGGWRHVVAAALTYVVVVGSVVIALRPFFDGDATRPGHDWADIHQVDALHVAEAQRDGELTPFWTFHLQGGAPLYAVPTKPLSYPPFLVAVRVAGPMLGMNLLLVLHAAFGGVAMVWLLRRVGVGAGGALIGGLLFTGATYPGSLFVSQPFWGYALAWWPAAMRFAIDLLEGRRTTRAGLLLGVSLAAMFHAGGVFQLYWLACFLVPFAIPYAIPSSFGPRRRILSVVGGAALAFGTFVGLAAVKLWPAIEWMKTSGRAGGLRDDEIFYTYDQLASGDGGASAWTVLAAMTLSGGKVGIVSLGVGAALGLLVGFRRRVVVGAGLALAAALVVALGLAHDTLHEWLPLYDRMRMPYRFFYPAGIAAIVLAAVAVDVVVRRLGRTHRVLGAAFVVVAAALVLADTARLPFVRLHRNSVSSGSERERMAAPVFDVVDDGSGARFHFPRPQDQALWVARGLDSTTGLLGGDGSENARYESALPFRTRDLGELERTHAQTLDLLATGFLASYEPLSNPTLRATARVGPASTGVDALVAVVDGEELSWGALGGDGVDDAYGVDVDPSGAVVVAGATASTEGSFAPGPIRGARAGVTDAYVATVDVERGRSAGVSLHPGAAEERAFDVAVDRSGVAWVVGRAVSATGAVDPFLAPIGRPAVVVPPPFLEEFLLGAAGEPRFTWRGSEHVVTFDPGGWTIETIASGGAGERLHCAVRIDFVDRTAGVSPRGSGPAAPEHRLVGLPSSHRRVDAWSRLVYEGVWPGVDLALSSTGAGLSLSLRIEPGADPSAVRLAIRGGDVRRSAEGMIIEAPLGPIRFGPWCGVGPASPRFDLVVTREGAERTDVALARDGSSASGDRALELVSTVALAAPVIPLGGAEEDQLKAIAIGPDGALFVAGNTASLGRGAPPEPGRVRTAAAPDFDVVVAKLSRDGALLWSTVIGGTNGDFAQGLAIDPLGRAVVIGSTRSDERSLPVTGGPSVDFGGVEDVLLLRLTADGTGIDFLGYLGGADGDYGQGVRIARDGTLVVCGDTKSDERSFPVRGGPDLTFNGEADAFVGRVAADGSEVLSLGYVGGDGIDVSYALALDADEDAWLVGVTASTEATFPVVDTWDGEAAGGGWDGFLVEVRRDLTAVSRSGFVGGGGVDNLRDVVVLAGGRIAAVGRTTSGPGSFGARQFLVGPRDEYEAYRTAHDRNPQLRSFVRPRVYRRLGPRPRAALVSDPVFVVGESGARDRAVRSLLDREAHDVHRTVLVEREDLDPERLDRHEVAAARAVVFATDRPVAADGGRPGIDRVWSRTERGLAPGPALEPIEAARVRFGSDRMEVDLTGLELRGRHLVVAETMTLHPGWSADVDGVPVPLRRADGIVTAVSLPPRAKLATFVFVPPGLIEGRAITLVTSLLLLVMLAVGHARAAGHRVGRVS